MSDVWSFTALVLIENPSLACETHAAESGVRTETFRTEVDKPVQIEPRAKTCLEAVDELVFTRYVETAVSCLPSGFGCYHTAQACCSASRAAYRCILQPTGARRTFPDWGAGNSCTTCRTREFRANRDMGRRKWSRSGPVRSGGLNHDEHEPCSPGPLERWVAGL